jgi:hypothetical protein
MVNSKVYEESRGVQNANCLFEADKERKEIVQTVFARDGSPASRQEKFMLDSDMAKFLKWIVHSLEIFEWEQDYGQNNNSFNVLGDDQIYSDEFDCFEEGMTGIEKEIDNVEPEAITWHVEVNYSNGTIQKISGIHVYLPEKVEELYWGFREFFAPAYSEEEDFEEDIEPQGGIDDDLPF